MNKIGKNWLVFHKIIYKIFEKIMASKKRPFFFFSRM